jgi:hypothetical protein
VSCGFKSRNRPSTIRGASKVVGLTEAMGSVIWQGASAILDYQETIRQAASSALLDLNVTVGRLPSLMAFRGALVDLVIGTNT